MRPNAIEIVSRDDGVLTTINLRDKLAACFMGLGLSTGHGETVDDLLSELSLNIAELHHQLKAYRHLDQVLKFLKERT